MILHALWSRVARQKIFFISSKAPRLSKIDMWEMCVRSALKLAKYCSTLVITISRWILLLLLSFLFISRNRCLFCKQWKQFEAKHTQTHTKRGWKWEQNNQKMKRKLNAQMVANNKRLLTSFSTLFIFCLFCVFFFRWNKLQDFAFHTVIKVAAVLNEPLLYDGRKIDGGIFYQFCEPYCRDRI